MVSLKRISLESIYGHSRTGKIAPTGASSFSRIMVYQEVMPPYKYDLNHVFMRFPVAGIISLNYKNHRHKLEIMITYTVL